MTNTFEFGRLVIIRRMSFGVAATICTCSLRERLRVSSIRNRFDGSATATVSMSRTHEQRQHEVCFDVFPRQQVDDFRIVQPGFELGVGHQYSSARHSTIWSSVQKPCSTRISPSSLLPRSARCASSARSSDSRVK